MKTNIKKIILITLLFLIIIPQVNAIDKIPPTITLIEPLDPQLNTSKPVITIGYDDPSGINRFSIELIVDDQLNVVRWETTKVNDNNITFTPPTMFAWNDGNHTLALTVSDKEGNTATETFEFTVDTPVVNERVFIDIMLVIRYVLIGTGLGLLFLTLYILYLKKTKNFTFEKYFAQNPIQTQVLTMYIPIAIAFIFLLFSVLFVNSINEPPAFALEYILVLSFFIGAGPYGIHIQLEHRKISKYEHAFAQFLFETADAMRGGLDPTKSLIELSKTDTSILQNHLRIAADNIRLGRPFDEVMVNLAKPINSDLIKRYATLIGDTSKIGGEPAQVIHRAAKDLDDFLKVTAERRRQIMGQATTIYVAFGVLLMVLYQLISIFPSITSIDVSLLGSGSIEDAAQQTVSNKMSVYELKQRFLDLLIINSIGTGSVIGSFIDGHFKYGLVHSMVLTLVSVVFFIALIL